MSKDLIYVACRKIGAKPGPWRDDEVRLMSRYDIEMSCRARWECERLDDMLARMGEADDCVYEVVEVDEDATKLSKIPAYEKLEELVVKYLELEFEPGTKEVVALESLEKGLEAIRKTPRVWVETWRKKS